MVCCGASTVSNDPRIPAAATSPEATAEILRKLSDGAAIRRVTSSGEIRNVTLFKDETSTAIFYVPTKKNDIRMLLKDVWEISSLNVNAFKKPQMWGPADFPFRVATRQRSFVFVADSAEEREAWITALSTLTRARRAMVDEDPVALA